MKRYPSILILSILVFGFFTVIAGAESIKDIYNATLVENDQETSNISFDELKKILKEKRATVIDARTPKEFAIDHIPGVFNVSGKLGGAITGAEYVADVEEIGRILKGNKSAPLVVYCSGPFCGKSKRLSRALLRAGYTNVRRFQLGIPVWRALGGITEVELGGVRYVAGKNQNAVFIDTRDPKEYEAGTILNSKNIHLSGVKEGKTDREVTRANKDGRLPIEDHNARIIVLGKNGAQARAVAEDIVRRAYHNVSYYPGTFETVRPEFDKSGK